MKKLGVCDAYHAGFDSPRGAQPAVMSADTDMGLVFVALFSTVVALARSIQTARMSGVQPRATGTGRWLVMESATGKESFMRRFGNQWQATSVIEL